MKEPKPSILFKTLMPDEINSKNIPEAGYKLMNYVCLYVPNDLTLEPQTSLGRYMNKISSLFK